MVPRSKFDRSYSHRHIVEAGLTLIAEAEEYAKSAFRSERRVYEMG